MKALLHRATNLVGVLLVGWLVTASPLAAQTVHLPPVKRVTLENGLQIVLMEYHRVPTLSVTALSTQGSASDPAGKSGLGELTATLLRRGAGTRTAEQFAEEIDFLGASLNSSANLESTRVTLNALAKDADPALDLLADVLRRPTLAPAEFTRLRLQAVAGLQGLTEDPVGIADRVAHETVYADHAYGGQPTISALQAFTVEDVQNCYRRVFAPDRMILVVIGDFSADKMLAKLRTRFADWPRNPEPVAEVAVVPTGRQREIIVDKPDATQTQVRFIRTAIPRSSSDYASAEVANAMLGIGFTSRLLDEIRVNRSLTYHITSRFETQRQGGAFVIDTYTKTETTGALIDATRNVLTRTAQSGFTPEEFAVHKGYLKGSFAIRLQTPEALAGHLAEMALYHLPEDYLQTYLAKLDAVTLADVNRVARAYFTPDTLSVILVGPAKTIQGQLHLPREPKVRPVDSIGK